MMLSLSILLLSPGSVYPNPGPNSINFSIAQLNVRGPNDIDKLSEMYVLACLYEFDVSAFSETWLNSSVSNDSILIPGYSLPLRKDRVRKLGGGVAIYAKDHIAVKRRVEFEYSAGLELLWVQYGFNNFVFLCGNQSANVEKAFLESLQMNFDKIKSCGQIFSAIVLLGDFNAHFNYGDTSSPNTDIDIRVFNFLESNNLYQLVDNPTRITRSEESIRDLIISDSPVLSQFVIIIALCNTCRDL